MYAWCFSHGRLHVFEGDPWCTATWVPLVALTEEAALRSKTERFGDAQFLHDLPYGRQLRLIFLTDQRNDSPEST